MMYKKKFNSICKENFFKFFFFFFSISVFNSIYSIEIINIKFAVTKDSEPFSYVEDNKIKGIAIDIFDEVFNYYYHNKYKIIIDYFPWIRAQYLVKKGDYDALFTIRTTEREEYANFSKNYIIKNNISMFYNKNNKNIRKIISAKSLNDIKELFFLDYLGDSLIKYHSNELGFKNEFSNNKLSALMKINKDRGDLFISTDLSAKYFIKKYKLNNILSKKIDFIKDDFNFYLCIRKTKKEQNTIINDFDKVINQSNFQNKINKIIKKYFK